ncbi:MAG TPA: ATP-binding cassette domain-containing protein [Steroidobacteraceae bacterium]
MARRVTRTRATVRRLVRIEVHDASLRLGRHWALREAAFELRAGEHWLLFGANGAGKTVLLKLLRGDLWPTPTGRESRRYVFADGETQEQPLEAHRYVAYLGPERQDRYDRHESTLTVEQVVLTGFDDSDFPLQPATAGQRRRMREVLQRIGLAGRLARPFRSLSYGQRRRVLLARALVRRPDVLLLDEALNGLDTRGRAAFVRALRRAVPQRTAWILTSHRRTDADLPEITHHAHIVHGRIEHSGPVTAAAQVDRGQVGPPAVRRMPSARRRVTGGQALLRLERAAVYRDGRPVIGAFDWTLVPGEHWHVCGANGSGKSTFMSLLYGDLWPAHGGRLSRRWPAVEDWKRVTGLVSPELHATYAATGCTVADIVASGLHDSIGLNELPTPSERRRVRRALREWHMEELVSRRARELSYGQLRLVLAARAFIRPRRLYLLDEPFDGLDSAAGSRLRARLDAAVRRGATLVMVTHHAEDLPSCVRNVLRMRLGRAPVVATR